MKQFLQHRSNRWGHDGWALKVVGAPSPLYWTVCTTRQEARELKHEPEARDPDLFRRVEVVKIKIRVEAVQ